MSSDLEKKVKKRKKDAKKKKLYEKVYCIAKTLGDESDYHQSDGGVAIFGDTRYKLGQEELTLTVGDYYSPNIGSYARVFLKGGKIFDEFKASKEGIKNKYPSEINAYIPGSWEQKLEKLYNNAQEIKARKEEEENNQSEDKFKKYANENFGLD